MSGAPPKPKAKAKAPVFKKAFLKLAPEPSKEQLAVDLTTTAPLAGEAVPTPQPPAGEPKPIQKRVMFRNTPNIKYISPRAAKKEPVPAETTNPFDFPESEFPEEFEWSDASSEDEDEEEEEEEDENDSERVTAAGLVATLESKEHVNPYSESVPKPYVTQDTKGFMLFIESRYNQFTLPPTLDKRINPNACTQQQLQTYKYQQFIREYMRQSAPYRGVLVYHGLGSGKTCTSIAAAEALYSQDKKHIIVMTPSALQQNFLNELMFCGFRHYRLKNVWYPFSLRDMEAQVFAIGMLDIPESYVKQVLKRPEEQRVMWLPDLSVDPDKASVQKDLSFYDNLQEWERDAIKKQIYAVLQNKITFLGYTGLTYDRLMTYATTKPDFFDNKVIIIDEIHNLTRLMAGKLDKYLGPGTKAKPEISGRRGPLYKKAPITETVGVDRWEPQNLPGGKRYERSYMFYRLLCGAKNSKIIALSGTPIVNKPVELGILCNILRGYFKGVYVKLKTTDPTAQKAATKVLEAHPRVHFYRFRQQSDSINLFFSILDEGYSKVFNPDGSLQGVLYTGAKTTPRTIEELFTEIAERFKANPKQVIPIADDPKFVAVPLFPADLQTFNDTFISLEENLKVKHTDVFLRRISGLISYYKGSKEELMPKVTRDEVIECIFSPFQQEQYTKVRIEEIGKEDAAKKKSKKQDPLDAALAEPAESYKVRSRAACNFVFPIDLPRPFPTRESDILDAIGVAAEVYGDTPFSNETAKQLEDVEKDLDVAREEEKEDVEEREAEAADLLGAATVKEVKPYPERVLEVLKELDERKNELFNMDDDVPEDQQLKTYSTKFYEMLKRINESSGSNLVYSNFKTLEGIGIFSLVLKANGYAPIELTGPETDLQFTSETIDSLLSMPEQPRYILYSGDLTPIVRQTLLNIFNCRLDKLPAKIVEILQASDVIDSKNWHGEICKVFMITGAGSEGLSLKNVRVVHILEPHWNMVRLNQVKGRAVRICSHAELPYSENPDENERTVEIYTYLTHFNPERTVDITILGHDSIKDPKTKKNVAVTTDEMIYDLAMQKDKLGANFLDLMKNGAVDCILNKADNEPEIRCYVVPFNQANPFLFNPILEEDLLQGELIKAAPAEPTKSVVKIKEVNGVQYKEKPDDAGNRYLYALTDIFYKKPVYQLLEGKDGKLRAKKLA